MAYTTIDDPTNYFDIVTYTGDGGSSKTITGLGFVSDFLWIKNRDATRSHILGNRLFSPPIIGAYDAVGGSTDTTINLSVTADVFSYIVFNEAIKAGYDGKGLVTINLTVSNNAKIGKNCIIGAKALITENKEIPDNSLVMGSPGKVVRDVAPEEIESITKNAIHYQENWKKYSKSIF